MENNFSNMTERDALERIVDNSYSSGGKHKLGSIIISNTQYIEWLREFCINRPAFCDDDWDFYPCPLNMCEYENVKRLKTFYDCIVEYAKKNKIDFEGTSVFIKYCQVGFEIGPTSANKYHSYFCKRLDISGNHNFIDFDDIIFHVTH